MLRTSVMWLGVLVLTVGGVTACARTSAQPSAVGPAPSFGGETPVAAVAPAPVDPSSAAPSKAVKPSPSRKPAPHPSTTLKKTVTAGGDTDGKVPATAGDGVPQLGAGTFTVAGGGTDVVGTGATLVKYRVSLENGITWGANPTWTPAQVAAVAEQAIGGSNGWTMSADHPVTYGPNKITDASWSFQRVSGDDFSVELRLATPGTVDKLCAAVGVHTQGVYSCRFGHTIMLNLRRWLRGIPGHASYNTYHEMTINHEMGHFLGFDHMKCPSAGKPAPIMETQTIDLQGCTFNSYPFLPDGTFVSGPWASS